jgi:hypothetical protein
MGATTSRIAVGVQSAVFATLYVMLETADSPHKPSLTTWALAVFQLLLDGLQVFQSIADLQLHSSLDIPSAVEFVDPENWIGAAFSQTPPWVVFGIASLVVLCVVFTSAWVSFRFFQERVEKIWPVSLLILSAFTSNALSKPDDVKVKLLNVFVAVLVTTFFTSVIEFLLRPLSCEFYTPSPCNMSSVWEGANVALSLLALLFAALFAAFALVASLLSFDISPLSLSPLSKTDGRLDTCFVAVKITFVAMAVANKHLFQSLRPPSTAVSPVFLPAIGIALTCALFLGQVVSAPYLNLSVNVIRAAILGGLCAAASCVAAANSRTIAADVSPPTFGAAVGAAMAVGGLIQWLRLRLLGRRIRALVSNVGQMRTPCAPIPTAVAPVVNVDSLRSLQDAVSTVDDLEVVFEDLKRLFVAASTSHEELFYAADVPPPFSPLDASLAVRIFSRMRPKPSPRALCAVLAATIRSDPQSSLVKASVLAAVHYLTKDMALVAPLAQMLRKQVLSVDSRFVVYTLDKKMMQEAQSSRAGESQLTAINLMGESFRPNTVMLISRRVSQDP